MSGEGWEKRHKKRINLSSDLKTFILILSHRHYLKWRIFHFVSLARPLYLFSFLSIVEVKIEKKAKARMRTKIKIIKKSKIVPFPFGCGSKTRHDFIAIQRQQLFHKVYFHAKKHERSSNERRNADVNVALMPRKRNFKKG